MYHCTLLAESMVDIFFFIIIVDLSFTCEEFDCTILAQEEHRWAKALSGGVHSLPVLSYFSNHLMSCWWWPCWAKVSAKPARCCGDHWPCGCGSVRRQQRRLLPWRLWPAHEVGPGVGNKGATTDPTMLHTFPTHGASRGSPVTPGRGPTPLTRLQLALQLLSTECRDE